METNVHAPQEKPESVQKRDTWAYSWTWRYNVALLQSVAAALPKALWHWNFEKRKNWMCGCFPEMIGMIENHKFLMFFSFSPWRAKSIHRAAETQIFTLESHACHLKWMSILQTIFDKSHKYQHFSLSLKNHNFKFVTLTRAASQPVALFYELFIVEKLIEMDDLGLPPFQENSIWIIEVETTKKMGSSGYFTNKIWQVLGDAAALYLPLDIPQLLLFHCDPPWRWSGAGFFLGEFHGILRTSGWIIKIAS